MKTRNKTRYFFCITTALIALLGTLGGSAQAASPNDRDAVLKARESVWRAWFANDTRTLQQLVPADAIVISSGEEEWKTQPKVFQEAAEFQAGGGKLIRLEFPRTEIQRFGDVAVIYTTYLVETDQAGKRSISAGRATEIFVLRNGRWVNAGWHTDNEK